MTRQSRSAAVMSLASRGEPAQGRGESVAGRPQGKERVCKDAIATEEREEAMDEGQGGKERMLECVAEDKQQKRKKTHGRRREAQGMNDKQVTQADGAAPASIRRSRLKQQGGDAEVQHSRRGRDGDKCPEEPRGPGPFFFFGGGNGASIVVPYCESRGWQRIYDQTRDDYKLKWCELKALQTYRSFRAGEQLVYQIPNNKILTTKIGLLNSLREYDRVSSKVNPKKGFRRMKMEEFFPATFRMDVKDERDDFFTQQEGLQVGKGNMWICKPTGLNQGRGIFLLRNLEDILAFKARIQNVADSITNRKTPFHMPQARIVQWYIQNPLLLKGKKFDVRSYFLIACTSPYMVFFRHGYVRVTCDLYAPDSCNLSAHFTNQSIQKKNPLYSTLKEETVWSMEHFNEYVNEKFMEPKGLPKDWVLSIFTKQMQQIMVQCFLAVKAKLDCKLGYFDLIGCDFLIDEDFKVWLLEMNCNPALHTNCEVLKDVVPRTVTETLDLILEIFNKRRCGLKLMPLSSQRDFVLLYCGEKLNVSSTKQRCSTAGRPRTVLPKCSSTPKKTNKTTLEPDRDNLENRSIGSTCSETMTNHSAPSLLDNSFASSSKVSLSSSFVGHAEPRQNSINGAAATPIAKATSETSVNYKVPFAACPSHSPSFTSSGPTLSEISPISCSQQIAKSQSKQVSGKTPKTQKNPSAKPAESSQRPSKAIPNRVQLQLNKCTFQQLGKSSDLSMLPEQARAKSTITTQSSLSLTEGSKFNRTFRAQASQDEQSVYFRPTELDLVHSLSCQPLRSVKLETSTSAEKGSTEMTDTHDNVLQY